MAVLSTPWYPDVDYSPEDYVPPYRLVSDNMLGLKSTAGILIAKVLAYNGPYNPQPTLSWRLDVRPELAEVYDTNNPFANLRSGWNTPAFVWTQPSSGAGAVSVSAPLSPTAGKMMMMMQPPPASCPYKTIEQLIKWIHAWFQEPLTRRDVERLATGQITPCMGCTLLARRAGRSAQFRADNHNHNNNSDGDDDVAAAFVRVAPPGPARIPASRHTGRRIDLLGDFVKWVGMTVAVDPSGVPIPHLFLTNDPSLRMRMEAAR